MKKIFCTILALVLLFSLAACGKQNSDSTNSSNNSPAPGGSSGSSPNAGTESGSNSNTGAGSESGSQGTEYPRSITIATSSMGSTMNPIRSSNNSGDYTYMSFIYEGLVGSKHTGSGYEPRLATSWSSNADATVWTFKLREGVTFHNGKPFDADDVVCSLQAVIDLGGESGRYLVYFPLLKAVNKVDKYTVDVVFETGFPLALDGLQSGLIFPHEEFEAMGEDLFKWENACGTGPWILDEWVDGEYTQYRKFENYWNKANYDSYFETVRLSHVTEASSLVAAHLAGNIQVYAPPSGMSIDLIPLYDSVLDRVDLYKVPIASIDYLTVQCREGTPGNDINFRKALSYAIDRDLIYGALFNGLGSGSVGFFFKDAPVANPSNTNYKYDPELAKQYLAQSNYDGRTLNYIVRAVVPKLNMEALAIVDMLAEVGIKAEVDPLEGVTYSERMAAGSYDLVMSSSPLSDFLPARFFTNILNDVNNTSFMDSVMLDMIRAFHAEIDDARRIEIGRNVGDRITEVYAPYIAVGNPYAVYAADKGITGLRFYNDGDNDVCYIDYDPSLAP